MRLSYRALKASRSNIDLQEYRGFRHYAVSELFEEVLTHASAYAEEHPRPLPEEIPGIIAPMESDYTEFAKELLRPIILNGTTRNFYTVVR